MSKASSCYTRASQYHVLQMIYDTNLSRVFASSMPLLHTFSYKDIVLLLSIFKLCYLYLLTGMWEIILRLTNLNWKLTFNAGFITQATKC